MTVRDLYCILHNVPASKTRWLNELIKNKNKLYYGKICRIIGDTGSGKSRSF